MSRSLVIIPTYNEKENILDIIDAVLLQDTSFDILIVDDSSPDGTAELVKEFQLKSKIGDRVFIEIRKGKLGLGTAYIHGFKWGLSRNYDYLFEMDADFSHNPKDLIRLQEACQNGADLSIGSRYCKGGAVSDWPLFRRFLSYGASLYVMLITGMPVKDPTAGFKCYKASTLDQINVDDITFSGYAFQIGMKYSVYREKLKIEEVPIVFKDREKGTSKMSMSIFKEALWLSLIHI